MSTALLMSALATAVVPALALRLRPPKRFADVLLAFVVAAVTLWASVQLVQRSHHLWLFEWLHLGYLVGVVSIPLLLGIWFVSAVIRRQQNWSLNIVGGLAALIAFGGVWGTHIEPERLDTERIAVTTSGVEVPIEIGVLADLQSPEVGDLEWRAIEALIEADPDLVVVPGDLFQGSIPVIDANADDFSALLATLVDNVGLVVVVSGDHDRSGQLPPIVANAGAIFLDNQIIEIEVDGQPIRLAGVEVFPSPAKAATIEALRTPVDIPTVLVSHRPGVTYELPADIDVDLTIAGHTHGGQVQLPFISDLIWYSDVPPAASNGGLSRINDHLLYVSTGVGLERGGAPQLRFGVTPEVNVVTLLPPNNFF